MPGIRSARISLAIAAAAACAMAGCNLFTPVPGGTAPPVVENPMLAPVADREFLWNQLTDALDDYFKIKREDRVRQIGGAITEGRLETYPAIGSTILEPWRTDATPGFEKLHGTLQSIRRRAVARVSPTAGGYLIDLAIFKELEDVPVPEHASPGSVVIPSSTSPVRDVEFDPARFGRVSQGWIPLGRDATLEQKILIDLRARLGLPPPSAPPLAGPSLAFP